MRRGDRPFQLDRGVQRRAAFQAALPCGEGFVRQTHCREQRRDPGERPADPDEGGRGVRGDGHPGLHRPEAVLRVGQRRPARNIRTAVRGDAGRAAGAGGRARAAARGAARRRGGRLRTARRTRHPAHLRGHPGSGHDPRLGCGHGLRRHGPAPPPPAAHRRVLPRRVVRAVRAVPGRVGTVRQEEALHRIAERRGAAAADDLAVLREVGRAMRDASICGLGQTAWNAVESAIDRLGAYE
ncbi:hypothetical protein N4G69_39760 [Streptomyces mirabilis]|nr:NADH-ubiquinone oxidoreductase-F iron-sulfur binding region domain-containing protein [Streptomyces mirabilis]MCT9111656.1 hypothetical protein [Streptomyces mirabilis]